MEVSEVLRRRSALVLSCLLAATQAPAQANPLPSWNDGAARTAIISFVQNNKATIDPGGLPLGGFGPAPEGLIAFLVGMGAIVAITLWMGSRA